MVTKFKLRSLLHVVDTFEPIEDAVADFKVGKDDGFEISIEIIRGSAEGYESGKK